MPTIARVLFKGKKLADQSRPIYLRLTHKRKPYFLAPYKNDARFRCFEQQWDEQKKLLKTNKKINPEYKIINDILILRETKLRNIVERYINENKPWSIDRIREEFYNTMEQMDVISFINEMVEASKKESENKFLSDLKRDLLLFNNNKTMFFDEVNYETTDEFIGFLKYKNCNNTTIGIRLRYLRKVLNSAIQKNIGCPSAYPFSSKYGATKCIKISQYEQNERKIAMDTSVIDRIKDARFDKLQDETARRLFLSSYVARGMNFRDMAMVSKEHIYKVGDDNYINYSRNKTGADINFKISPLLQENLTWFEENCKLVGDALFPIIQDETIDNLYDYLHNKLNSFNYRLKKIAKALDIDKSEMKMSSYTARHSFATGLLHNGININKISQTLGHKNVKTTYHYLKPYAEDVLSDEVEAITG